MCYGTLLIVYAKNSDRRIPLVLRYMLMSMSLMSLTLNVSRALVLVWILDTDEFDMDCVEFGYDRDSA